jgi:hypothetical protein
VKPLANDDFYVHYKQGNSYYGNFSYYSPVGLALLSDIIANAFKHAGIDPFAVSLKVRGATADAGYPSPNTHILGDIRVKGEKLHYHLRGRGMREISLAVPNISEVLGEQIKENVSRMKSKFLKNGSLTPQE